MQGREKLRYSVRCTYLEIYREELADLLRPGGPPLTLRLDAARGAFVDGLEERDIFNSALSARLRQQMLCSVRIRKAAVLALSPWHARVIQDPSGASSCRLSLRLAVARRWHGGRSVP